MFSKGKSKKENINKQTKNGSTEVLQNILNGMNAYIYVSDPQTDEILFINDKLKKHFKLKDGEGVGSVCWKVLQNGINERCSFCPVPKLNKDSETFVKWEEHNTLTKRYYKNTDSFIEWTDGRKVHLQHSIDITDIKAAGIDLEKRISQQELMTEISKIFISGESIDAQIKKAMQIAGNFMEIETVKFYSYDKNRQALDLMSLWTALPSMSSEMGAVEFKEGNEFYNAFVIEKRPYVILDDISENADFPLAASIGVKSLMSFPVVVSQELWGILVFDSMSLVKWTESDKQLANLMASILSGSIMRMNTERSLIKMSSIAENSFHYITCTDIEDKFTYINPAVTRITGYTKEELFEHGLSILNKDNNNGRVQRKEIMSHLAKDGHYSFENTITTKSGKKLLMLMSLFFIDKEKTEIGCIAMDITEQRRLEKEIVKAKDAAESANMAKGEFLARMSHEIRTPINAVIGMTTIARSSADIEKKDYCLEKIDIASTHLLGIINDILDMSKIEANKFDLVESEFSLERMIENVVSVVSFRIEQKQQTLIINIDRSVPKFVIGDEMRLNQVVMNLLTNAAKFTYESGVIKLNVKKIAREGNELTLKFEVQDTGIGISKQHQAKLFKSFEQADGSISRRFGGTGLGLAISKRIVELMGGDISVESELNRGAKFIFTVKVKKGENKRETIIDSDIDIKNLRVLAIDDTKEVRDYFLNLMEKFSIKCDVASGGREALELIRKNKNEPYNIIYIDWMMPGMDGIELAREIKKENSENCVIIMISTAKWAEIEEQATAAGVDKFIGKPLFPSALINIINESFSGGVMLNTKNTADSMQAEKKPNYEGKSILVAEDTEINREIIKAFLQNTKVKLDFAANGLEAVDMFKAAPDKYGLILMDVQMPKMDGLEATRKIRALDIDRAKTIPIVALTANVFNEDIRECLSAGMNSHIGKPIDMNSMFVTLRKYLPETTDQPSQEGYSSFLPYINVEEGLGRIMNDRKLYFKLLDSFDGKKYLVDLVENIEAGDLKSAAVSAHTIKGIAANLGLTALWELSKEVEAQAKQGNNLSGYVYDITKVMNKTLDLIIELTKN